MAMYNQELASDSLVTSKYPNILNFEVAINEKFMPNSENTSCRAMCVTSVIL